MTLILESWRYWTWLLIRGDNQVRGNGQGGIEELERGLSRDHDRRGLRANDPTFRLFEGFWGNWRSLYSDFSRQV